MEKLSRANRKSLNCTFNFLILFHVCVCMFNLFHSFAVLFLFAVYLIRVSILWIVNWLADCGLYRCPCEQSTVSNCLFNISTYYIDCIWKHDHWQTLQDVKELIIYYYLLIITIKLRSQNIFAYIVKSEPILANH